MKFLKTSLLFLGLTALSTMGYSQTTLKTNYFKIVVDQKGYITSMQNITKKSNLI